MTSESAILHKRLGAAIAATANWRVHQFVAAVLLLAGTVASGSVLAAGNLRCDTDLVSRGATFYEVLERCGEPAFEFGRVDFRYPGYTVQLDEWTYEQGTNRFRRVLHFENGRLRHIELRGKPLSGRFTNRSGR